METIFTPEVKIHICPFTYKWTQYMVFIYIHHNWKTIATEAILEGGGELFLWCTPLKIYIYIIRANKNVQGPKVQRQTETQSKPTFMIKHLSVEVPGKEQGRPNEELRGGASFHVNEHITDLQSVHVKWQPSKTSPNQLHCFGAWLVASQRLLASVTQR